MPKRKPIDVSIPEGQNLPPGYRLTQGPRGGYRLSMPHGGGSYSNRNLGTLLNLANQGYQNSQMPRTGPLPSAGPSTGGGEASMAPSGGFLAQQPPLPPEMKFHLQGGPSQTSSTPQTGGGLEVINRPPATTQPNPSTANPTGGPAGSNPYEGIPGLPSLYSQQDNPFKAPELPAYQFQNSQAPQMFNDVFNQATGGTINAYNTAANRLRERLDASTRAAQNAAQNQYLGRGLGASGLNQATQFRTQQIGQNAYAQGLSDLANQFEQQRQQGLQTALGAGQGLGQQSQAMNALMQQELQQRRELAQQGYQFGSAQEQANRQFMDRLLIDLQNSREGRSAQEMLQRMQQNWQTGENAKQNELQRFLASLGLGNQPPPTVINIPGGGYIPPEHGISGPYPEQPDWHLGS